VEPKRAYFGTASAIFAVLSVVLPVLIGVFFASRVEKETNEQAKAWAPLGAFFATMIVSFFADAITSVLGIVSGLIALGRREQWKWLAVVGLVVNVPIVLFLVYMLAVVQMHGS